MMKFIIAILLASIAIDNADARDRAIPQFTRINTPTIANFGPGCRIAISIPEKSLLRAYYGPEENLGSGGLRVSGMPYQDSKSLVGFRCYRADDGFVKSGWAIPKPGGGWQPNNSSISVAELLPLQAFHYHDLIAKEARGWAVTVDDTFGEEKTRQRQLSYCLVHESKAICDQDFVGYLEDIKRNKRADLTPYILDLLRTVEFLEDAPPLDSGNRRP